MSEEKFTTCDGNEAVATVAYQLNELIAIYPITPASPMGEAADLWASQGRPNLWNTVPRVVEMQSEGGAAGALHGALQTGSLATTFTASQGLLLMIPNMYKIAGELTPTVIHVASRSVAAQALSIFCDHSDCMAARSTGFALLCSASVQEAQDFALLAQAASLESRLPFLHFFDGFRTSHEISKIATLSTGTMKALLDEEKIIEHRRRALSPDHPVIRGTAQNPDVFFQARESVNSYYQKAPGILQNLMDHLGELTGRKYRLFEYAGDPRAERVIVLMGSGAETAEETARHLSKKGEKVGVVKVRLYRPFDTRAFCQSLPPSVKSIAVLDRTKEPGSDGEPLYLDCTRAIVEGYHQGWIEKMPRLVGGRFGLSSKEFTPGMVRGIFHHLKGENLKNKFTIGITDDVTHTSLDFDSDYSITDGEVFQGIFYGLGSDGTVGANKNSIKIIGESTENYTQGYFVYDSRKAGAVTISHLRFGPQKIRAPYLIEEADFVACHQWGFTERFAMLDEIKPGGTFLINSPYKKDQIWDKLPRPLQKIIGEKNLKFYSIDAYQLAREAGLGSRINTVMQACFFKLTPILPWEKAKEAIGSSIRKTYGKKGEEIVKRNLQALDKALDFLWEIEIPDESKGEERMREPVASGAPDFVKDVLGKIIARQGDELPVSAFPADGTYPVGTARWEKRNLAHEIPLWEPHICIQCSKCTLVCPHGVIRAKICRPEDLEEAPESFLSAQARDRDWKGLMYLLQVAPEDCTGCGICVEVCPVRSKSEARKKAINMTLQAPLREREKENWNFFRSLPEWDRSQIKTSSVRQQQIQEPLFEFSGACAGCGETPYLKLLTQLFGDRSLVANATGCSSIYGGNLPTTPWAANSEGRGPAWSNSLFEDNAEFGLGFRLSIDKQTELARELVKDHSSQIGEDLVREIFEARQIEEEEIFAQRERVALLKERLAGSDSPQTKRLLSLADYLVKKSVWIVGGDGWAYDIGFGGLDHVIASGEDVNILVLDTEVYSNTGGQMSKATPRAAVAKFAAGGKRAGKKDLGLMAMTYGNAYVASVAMGARDEHTLRAFLEAEKYQGPSLIIAYSHCIAHGIDMSRGMENQKLAVETGQWPLYRFHPERLQKGENPFQLDMGPPKKALEEYFLRENRFKMLTKINPETSKELFRKARQDVEARWKLYSFLARGMATNDQ